jgi:hypothetical protein
VAGLRVPTSGEPAFDGADVADDISPDDIIPVF